MPICNCQSHGCTNQKLNHRTFKAHQDEDQITWRRKAYQQMQKTIQKQDQALASEVTSLVFCDPIVSRHTSTPDVVLPHNSCDTPWEELDRIDIALSTTFAGTPEFPRGVMRPSVRGEKFPWTEQILQARSLQARVSRIPTSSVQLRSRRHELSQRVQELLRRLMQAGQLWKRMSEELGPPTGSSLYNTEHHFQLVLDGVDPIIQVTLFTMVALQVVLHLSRRGCHFLLLMARYIVQLAFQHERKDLSEKKTRFVENFPTDPDSATTNFLLDGKETIYAVCPNSKCHKTYPPTYVGQSTIPRYPKFCTHKDFHANDSCNTALTQKRMYHEVEIRVPIKVYVAFSFKDFVANLLSRPGFEDLMDNPKKCSVQGQMVDIQDGEFITIFTDANSEPFASTIDVGRYTFSICMDFFNPFFNKQAGKKVSIGIISVVCLSLPYTHRYKFENMFLAGVIPGPNEPPLTATNHYLKPLVDDFLDFWQPGVRFSRTHNQPGGRLVLCGLILVICDLLGARKAAGLAACTHEHFCSICHCTKSSHGYGSTTYEDWERRTDTEIRNAAASYKGAATDNEAQKIFDQSGVRWSELLRLPYFNPTRCVTVDSMHNLFLGLLKEHFMNILGIGLPVEREQPVLVLNLPPLPSHFTANDDKGVRKLKKLFEGPASISLPEDRGLALSKLTQATTKALKFMCSSVGCAIPSDSLKPTKTTIAGYLLDWRLAQTEFRQPHADTFTRKGHVLDLDDMKEIWRDLRTIITPSWMGSVPSNLGNPSHGKLKADQWRTLGTLHLPLSLIRIWGTIDPRSGRSTRCHQILNVTMSLLSAVIIAVSRTTSTRHADAYLQHMREYLDGIKTLFPDYEFRPNHHMALHLQEFILLFGPVQSWWTFPFERMIGALQRMPHNSKIGELETTIARSYTRSASLRALLTKSGCPEVIHKSETLFQRLVDPQIRESLQIAIPSFEGIADDHGVDGDSTIPSTIRPLCDELVLAFQVIGVTSLRDGCFFTQMNINGLTYSTSTKHQGNSCAILVDSTPAEIQHIVRLQSRPNDWYLAIRRHKPSHRRHNPYNLYPILGATIWSSQLDRLEIVPSGDIQCHFASLCYDEESIVVLSLLHSIFL